MTDEAMRMGDRGYPRPQFVRDGWISLDGEWQFAVDADARWHRPSDVAWDDAQLGALGRKLFTVYLGAPGWPAKPRTPTGMRWIP